MEPILVGGSWEKTPRTRPVINPYDGKEAFQVCQADSVHLDAAIAASATAFRSGALEPAYIRARILEHVSSALADRKEEFGRLITAETGKPISFSNQEVERAVLTLKTSAEEAKRVEGRVLPLDLIEASQGRRALVQEFPIGPITAITPFNFPLNLVAHKLGPAIATGCPVLLKPSSNAPVTALRLGRLFGDAGLPAGYLSILPCTGDEIDQLIVDKRVKLITFTGSPAVGWPLKLRAGKKRVLLELGGNAAVIVHKDASLPLAIGKIVTGGFGNAGQSCISVQRVYAHKEVFEAVRSELVAATRAIAVGDPWDARTVVGPMITAEAAEKAEGWVMRAVANGATLLCGGKRVGAVLQPVVLTNVRKDEPVVCNEVFAPIMVLEKYETETEVLSAVNDSAFGLQAGLFTNDAAFIFRAYHDLEVGGLIINDSSAYRMDHMPYGGTKDSGFGREGVRYAMEEMMEKKLLALSFPH
ncbi:MAG: aldehyde dehydrogenase family protein [Bacteroidota bacterium]